MNDVFKTLSSTTVDEIADYAIGHDNQFRKHAGLELLLSIWKRERLETAVNSDWYKDLGDAPLTSQPMEFVDSDDQPSDTYSTIARKSTVRANEIHLGKKYYIYNNVSEQVRTVTEICSITKIGYQKFRYWMKKGNGSFFINGYYITEVALNLNQHAVKLSLTEGLRKSENIANRKVEVYSKFNNQLIATYTSVKEAADTLYTLPTNIYKVLNKKADSHKGYIFKYTSW